MTITITIPADPRAIARVTAEVTRLLNARGWSARDVMQVELAVQEAVANSIRHGCGGDPSKELHLFARCDDGELVITLRDPGAGFDPAAVPDPLHPDNMLKPGGRGIFLIQGLMDQVHYADGGRELRMHKRRTYN